MHGVLRRLWSSVIPENNFARGASVLMLGTASAQIILLFVTPILTRLYSPEAFGTLALLVTSVTLLSIVATGRYESAVTLPEQDAEATLLVVLALFIMLATALVLTTVVYFFGDSLLAALGLSPLIPFKYLIPLSVIVLVTQQVLVSWAVRQKLFLVICQTRIAGAIAGSLVQIGASTIGVFGLLIGNVFVAAAGVLRIGRAFFCGDSWRQLRSALSLRALKKVAISYRQFPLFAVPNGLLNTAGRELPTVILASMFGPALAGNYFLSSRVFRSPITVVTEATSKVFISEAPAAHREDRLGSLFEQVFELMVKVFMLPLALVSAISPQLFGVVFGDEWVEAGIMSQILMPWVTMIAITNPLSSVVGVINRQNVGFYFEILLACLRLGGLVLGGLFGDAMLAISLFVGGAVVGIFIKLAWMAVASGAGLQKLGYLYVKEVTLALSAFALAVWLEGFFPHVVYYVVLAGLMLFAGVRSMKLMLRGIVDG